MDTWSLTSWKKHVKCLLHTNALLSHQLDCSHLPISQCSFELGKPLPLWSVTRSLPILTRRNNFRIRLLVGCDGLEHDVCRFRIRRFPPTDYSSVCKLRLLEPEDQAHFIVRCPRLEAVRSWRSINSAYRTSKWALTVGLEEVCGGAT